MDPSFLITPLYNWILWKDFSLLVVSTVYGQEVAAHFSTERMELRLLLYKFRVGTCSSSRLATQTRRYSRLTAGPPEI
jgi:hypothetical protein